jgi:hypothetical protein
VATQTSTPATESEYTSRTQIDTAVAGTIVLAAAVAGVRQRLYQLVLNTHAAQLATIRSSGGTVLIPTLALGASGGVVLDFGGHPWATSLTGEGLDLVLANAAQTSGVAWTREAA